MVGQLLDVLFGLLVAAFPGARRRRSTGVLDPAVWPDPDTTPWTIAIAVSLSLPLVVLGSALVRLVVTVFELADDPMLVFFALLFALPAAFLATMLFGLVVSAALWLVGALLARREGATWFVAVYAVGAAGLAVAFLTRSLDGYGWALLGAAAVTITLLLARRTA